MSTGFILLTLLFVVVSVAMVLIILVQRPSGGGLAGAFGGAGGSGTESVFGGRVGDALTWATVIAFVIYLTVAISLNLVGDEDPVALGEPTPIDVSQEPAPAPTPTPSPAQTPGGRLELRPDATGRPSIEQVPPDEVPEFLGDPAAPTEPAGDPE